MTGGEHWTRLEPWHVRAVNPQASQVRQWKALNDYDIDGLSAFTGFAVLDGARVLGVGGFIPVWEHRTIVWSILSGGIGHLFWRVHRVAMAAVQSRQERRLEMTVACDDGNGHRWAKMLGFEVEVPVMRHYFPWGDDASQYVRVL